MVTIAGVAGLGTVLLAAALLIVLRVVGKGHEKPALRKIAAIDRLTQSIGLAVENGTRTHITVGNASLTQPSNPSALAGLATLERVARISSISDRPPLTTSGDGGLTLLSQDTSRGAYRAVHAPELYDSSRARLTGVTPLSYVAGMLPIGSNEDISAHVMIGNFGPEIGLVAEAADQAGAFNLAASDSLPAQAVLFATASDPIIGEELFATPAYLDSNRTQAVSLQVQDILRWGVGIVLIGGAILKLVGIL